MRKRVLSIICILICITFVFIAGEKVVQAYDNNEKTSTEFIEELDSKVPELIKKYNIQGTSVGIIKNGELECILNYGEADRKLDKKVTDDTLFQAASVSKSVTAYGVMKLVEDGIINLDDPAEKYLTRWHFKDSEFNKNEITIRQLLSHTAGLSVDGYLGTDPDKTLKTLEESLDTENGGVKIENKPGEVFSYSGGGYTVLQLIIEEVTGVSFETYMKNAVLGPLKMDSSTFANNIEDEKMSSAYGGFNNKIPNYNFTEQAAAGLKTTVNDFSKFILSNFNESFLKKETIDLMHKEVKGGCGLGFFVSELSDGTKIISHSGSNLGWKSYYGLIEEKKDGIIIFTNSNAGAEIVFDISNMWINYETGEYPEAYYELESLRKSMASIIILASLALILYVSIISVNIIRKKRTLLRITDKKSLIKLAIRILISALILGTLYYLGYTTGLLIFRYQLMIAMYQLKYIVYLIVIWCLVFSISGFFKKYKY